MKENGIGWFRRFGVIAMLAMASTSFAQSNANLYAAKTASPEIFEIAHKGQGQDLLVDIDDQGISRASAKKRMGITQQAEVDRKTAFGAAVAAIDPRRKSADDRAVQELQTNLKSRKDAILAPLLKLGIKVVDDFPSSNTVTLHVPDEAALGALLKNPSVTVVNSIHEVTMTGGMTGVDYVSAPIVNAAGHTGAGTRVVLLDTTASQQGLNMTGTCNPWDPSTDVFRQDLLQGHTAGCMLWSEWDFATPSTAAQLPVVNGDRQGCINWGHANVDLEIVHKAAPGAWLTLLQVVDCAGNSNENYVLHALDWLIQHSQDQPKVVAVNLSLAIGTQKFSSACSAIQEASKFATLVANGIIPVVATGNNGWRDGVRAPACAPGVIAVSAVANAAESAFTVPGVCNQSAMSADQVPCFADTAPNVPYVYAPGVNVNAGNNQHAWYGTSQAAPIVAAEIAVLRAADVVPTKTATEVINLITSTGTSIAAPAPARNRVDFQAAVNKALAPVLTKIVVQPNPAVVILGRTTQAYALGYDQFGQPMAIPHVTWATTSSNSSVDVNGLLSGKMLGAATLQASYGGVLGSAQLSVENARLTRIDVSPTGATIAVTQRLQMSYFGWDQTNNAMPIDAVTWYTPDAPANLVVTQTGLVTGMAQGVSFVQVTANGVTGSTTVVCQGTRVGPPKPPNCSTNPRSCAVATPKPKPKSH
jgi:hypothetical protein